VTATIALPGPKGVVPVPSQGPPLLVVGSPFSGATTLAWALGQHPELEPVVGAEATGHLLSALRILEEDVLPILSRVAEPAPVLEPRPANRTRSWVIGGPELASRLDALRGLFPDIRFAHVERSPDEVLPLLVEASRRSGGDLSADAAHAIWRRIAGACLDAERRAGSDRVLRVPYDLLVRHPEEAVRRCLAVVGKEPSAACLWPLRLLTTMPLRRRAAGADLRSVPVASSPRQNTPAGNPFHRRLRQLVESIVPQAATVLVASRGDEELLRFRDRPGRHFPQLDGGEWAGFYPVDGAAAVEHLRALTADGASHLVFPKPALWWLDHYGELRDHLERSARLIACDRELAVVWDLGGAAPLALPPTLQADPQPPTEPDNHRAFVIRQGRGAAPPRRPRRLGGSFWAVTTFYNPAGYRSKKQNYDRFRSGLVEAGVPLLAVELAFGEAPFELGADDAELLVQLRGGDVMWQKERLLNIGVRRLPDACDKVAWLDADLLFARSDWARETAHLLERYVAVQPFSHSVRLPPGPLGCEPAMLPFGAAEGQLFYGIAWGVRAKGRHTLKSYDEHGHTGFAWAARRRLLEAHGLYEANLLGNGDTDIAHAMLGNSDYWGLRRLGERAQLHLRGWAAPFSAAVGRSVAHVDGVVTHLWHGETQHRLYNRPLDVLHAFDPERHLASDREGLLTFTDDAPAELRAWSREYFSVRREDG
jgi:Sulfotransferase family